jgi:arylsulfatase A-like enzyme
MIRKPLVLLLATCAIALADKRPNIVFLFTDDQPQNCLGFQGNKDLKTPHLDGLATRGTYFNNAFITTAICCTSRASILTGQHMRRHGITDFKKPLSEKAFDQTYPALLKEAGYRTGYLGKYAIGNPAFADKELALPAHRFDDWYGFPQSINFRQKVGKDTRFLTSVMTERAVKFFEESKPDQPFCLTVAFKEPHGPFNYFDPQIPDPYQDIQLPAPPTFNTKDWMSQPEFIRKSLNGDGSEAKQKDPQRFQKDQRIFYRTVSRADTAVGEILAALKRLNLDDNTVIIFSSDHGSLLGDHGLSGKWLMYENSIRVPLIIFDPRADEEKACGRRDQIALNIDLAPTILSLAGITPPKAMQGRDLMPLVHGKDQAWRKSFFYEHTYDTDPPRSPIAQSEGIRTDRWKYIRYPKTTPIFEQLFDLQNDPLEQVNLASDPPHAGQMTILRNQCEEARKTEGSTF